MLKSNYKFPLFAFHNTQERFINACYSKETFVIFRKNIILFMKYFGVI